MMGGRVVWSGVGGNSGVDAYSMRLLVGLVSLFSGFRNIFSTFVSFDMFIFYTSVFSFSCML